MRTKTILDCPFQLKPSPHGAWLLDPRWQHLPWLINPAVANQSRGVREAVARRDRWSDGEGGVSVVPVAAPGASEYFANVPNDEVWAKVVATFVRAPADILPYCVIEQLIATLDADSAKPRVPAPWLFVDPALFDEPSEEERVAMIDFEQRISQLSHLDHAALEECRQAGLLAEARAEDRARWLSALGCPTLELHVRAVIRTWAYLRSEARRLQIPEATIPANFLDANVSLELFVLQPEISDRIAAYAEMVLEHSQLRQPCEGDSGTRLRHNASGWLNLAWRRGPRGQAQVVAARLTREGGRERQ